MECVVVLHRVRRTSRPGRGSLDHLIVARAARASDELSETVIRNAPAANRTRRRLPDQEGPGITILHFAGERVVERFSQADMLGLMAQLGAIPALA
jgi:hypothetical protein